MTTYGRGLKTLALATAGFITLAFALVFFYAPLDADQGFIQKIFYVHVPLAIVSLCGFILGGIFAIGHLRSGDRKWDMRSYVAIHMSLIFSVGALITGSIWAKASWGHWWVWNEPTLVSFLIVVLMFATYQPLRFSIEDPERQARYASVFSIVAGAFVPLNFLAVRLAQGFVHPRVLTLTGGHLPGAMRLTFFVSLIGMALLFATLWRFEMAAKNARMQTRRLRRMILGDDDLDARPPERGALMTLLAAAPALPLHTAGKYVAGAYVVFLALVLIYVAIMAIRLGRTEKEIAELARDVQARRDDAAAQAAEREVEPVSAMSELLAIGVSHKTAPVEVRERLALPEARVGEFLRELRGDTDIHEAVAISTCNRTELYLVVGDAGRGREHRAGDARPAGRDPSHGLGRGDLLAPQLRRRPPPLPRHRGARVDDRRRSRDPGPGQAGLRDGAGQGVDGAAHQPPVPRRAHRGQAGPDRDRDR